MAQGTFVDRLQPAIGKPVATLFVEQGEDRHFILELALQSVALYLGGKFLDGFIEGLGIGELGKAAAAKVKAALIQAGKAIAGEEADGAEIDRQSRLLQSVADELAPRRGDGDAYGQGEAAVRAELEERGLPKGEAERLARLVGDGVFYLG